MLRFAMVSAFLLSGVLAQQKRTITGTAAYLDRSALPPGAVLEISLEDVSLADAKSKQIALTRMQSPGQVPIPFTIAFDPGMIDEKHRYSVRARILIEDRLVYTTDQSNPVLTEGHGNDVKLILRRAGANAPTFENTGWKLIELDGKPIVATDPKRAASLRFDSKTSQVSGSTGCNGAGGSFVRKGNTLTVGPLIGTMMACEEPAMSQENLFKKVLETVTGWKIEEGQLHLLAGETVVAKFAAGSMV